MDCPGAEVEWEGLDTDLGNIISDQEQSILTLSSATINMEGTKACSGQCPQGVSSVAKVELKVYYTLQLDSQPKTLTVGRPARLLCSISHVYPHGALTLSWFRGDEPLEASRELEEEEMEEEEEQLFVYRSELELPTVAEAVAYKCKATLKIDERNFAEEKVATAMASPKSTSTLESLTKDHNSITGVNNLTGSSDPTDQELTTKPLSTANGFSTGGTTEKLTTKPLSMTSGFSTGGSTEEPTTNPLSMANRFSTGGTTEKPKDACRPMIVPVPAEGTMGSTLRITCQTSECRRGVQIQWVETPVAQSRYRLEEAEGQSTLMVENVSLEHQGLYRCVAIASPPRIASLRVVVSAANVNTDALFTIGATGSLLGLIIVGYVSHRWRQRRRW
ncbi:mucosal addressin cell adhesion molecule 1 [Protobothrops mucrosquamatus]|uniref:mucosal addressin cell adhesion molecule 1 n=1 Tax=Protobothrops mucrosquamatus TaxID=103944 RepID=UPI000775AC59|nr:mucosal addressin cell adhesion molecule 1 [Protobothrops mucrosquamatus]